MIDYGTFPFPLDTDIIKGYIQDGNDPKHFRAALENNFIECMTSTDEIGLPILHSLALWLYTEVPAHCMGSRDKVARWMARGGYRGEPYTAFLDFKAPDTD